jgi:hypothetical protein
LLETRRSGWASSPDFLFGKNLGLARARSRLLPPERDRTALRGELARRAAFLRKIEARFSNW